ncbi:MAG: hypothetical protein CM15mP74_34850 [Halieaceae bacterium]|nr:MAG: hypothetical protein CM15mP74_34850 [Halieaceae bacterium]
MTISRTIPPPSKVLFMPCAPRRLRQADSDDRAALNTMRLGEHKAHLLPAQPMRISRCGLIHLVSTGI